MWKVCECECEISSVIDQWNKKKKLRNRDVWTDIFVNSKIVPSNCNYSMINHWQPLNLWHAFFFFFSPCDIFYFAFCLVFNSYNEGTDIVLAELPYFSKKLLALGGSLYFHHAPACWLYLSYSPSQGLWNIVTRSIFVLWLKPATAKHHTVIHSLSPVEMRERTGSKIKLMSWEKSYLIR